VFETLSVDRVYEAAERIRPLAHRTPVMSSRGFDEEAGLRACFKCENLQRGGSFKIRGAANFVLSLPREELPMGVVAFSSGNHAQAVAIAARFAGTHATIVMPSDAPRSKVEATRANGARIVFTESLAEREAVCRGIAEETGASFVPPFDHPWIMAGQGTAGLELIEEVPDLEALIAPVGGGGLLSGCGVAVRAVNPKIRIFGAEPAAASDTFLSLEAGEHVGIEPPVTLADGLRTLRPGALTFPILKSLAEAVVLVTEDEIAAALKFVLLRMKILIEPSAAVAVAAVLFRKLPAEVRSVGIIVSGGNVDYEVLRAL